MKAVFAPLPANQQEVTARPKTTSSIDFITNGHSSTLGRHRYETCEKYEARARPVLKQRYLSYPVSVPDLSKEATDETIRRRQMHKEILEEDVTAFRKKFTNECTSDYFYQKHLVRDYLNTLHPYVDLNNLGSYVYTESRLKSRQAATQANEQEHNGPPIEDFLRPKDPTRPRSTGYSPGHMRSMLGLDSYGPKSSEENCMAREDGRLPSTPNIDRYRASSSTNSTVSSPTSSVDSSGGGGGSKTRPKTYSGHRGSAPVDSAETYLPFLGSPIARTVAVEALTNETQDFQVVDLNTRPTTAVTEGQTSSKKKNAAGTLGYYGPALTKEEKMLKDPFGRGVEWFTKHIDGKKVRARKAKHTTVFVRLIMKTPSIIPFIFHAHLTRMQTHTHTHTHTQTTESKRRQVVKKGGAAKAQDDRTRSFIGQERTRLF